MSAFRSLTTWIRRWRESDETASPSAVETSIEEKYADLLRQFQVLTNNLAASVMLRDSDNRIRYCSPYTEVLTGYARAEIYAVTGDFMETIVHPDDRERYQRSLKVAEFGEPFQVRYRFFHKSGLEMWAESRTVPILTDEGSDSASLSISLDVTATVRYQRQIEEKNRDLQDFTYMVSHDMKAPLFTIKGMLGIIRDDYPEGLPSGLQETLDHISRAAERLDQLVGSVLRYSALSAEDIAISPVDLNSVLHDVIHDLSPLPPTARIAVTSDLPIVRGEPLKLYQLFSNLLSNSMKYRDPTRDLEVTVSTAEHRNPHLVSIAVRDNGIGIPASKLGVIFRPFQRAHSTNVEGSGIGLASVKRLCDKLGGEVKVESSVGSGSIFTVTLQRGSPL